MTYVTTYTPKVIKLYEIVYKVESLSRQGVFYSVIFKENKPKSCTCPSYELRYREKKEWCKHMLALMDAIEDGKVIDESAKKQQLKAIPKHVGMDAKYEL